GRPRGRAEWRRTSWLAAAGGPGVRRRQARRVEHPDRPRVGGAAPGRAVDPGARRLLLDRRDAGAAGLRAAVAPPSVRRPGRQPYGALASLLAVLLVISVIQLGIQTTAARRIAADPGHVGQIEREILSLTYRAAAVVGVALLLLTPVINVLLKLDSLATASM